jgi:hypothetical protein
VAKRRFDLVAFRARLKSYGFMVDDRNHKAFSRFCLYPGEKSGLTSDLSEKFPHPEMKPNSRVKLIAAMHLGSPLKYQVKLSWKNSSGESQSEIFWVTR